jgi:protein-disulfide isomerase
VTRVNHDVRCTVRAVRGFLRSRAALFVAVGIAAVGIAAGLIVASVVGSGGKKKAVPTTVASTSSSTTTAPGGTANGAAATKKLFRGIPQRLNVLGNPQAPVTMVEFADPQCPFCREFALGGLPAIVREYVRPGKVKLVFAGLAFIGSDSEVALRATYAAGLQSRLWDFLDLLYRNQGAENSGWVTDGLLREVGGSIAGLDVDAMLAARQTAEVDNAIVATGQQATSAHVNGTPTFFAGRTGATLQFINVSELRPQAFRPTLDALLK